MADNPSQISSSSSTPPAPSAAAPGPLLQWSLRLGAYPLFFCSGAAGLIYEVAWTRQLLYIFGSGLYAICAVLCAFMAGLALGAWIAGRWSDRLRRPLLAYAVLELGVAAFGVLLAGGLGRLHMIDAWAYHLWGQNFAMLTLFRFVLAFVAMLVPTTLMGATLPVLSRFMVRERTHLALHVGGLYATNTTGAVTGAFAAGFVLIINFGLFHTQLLAAGLNLLVAVLAAGSSMLIERDAATPSFSKTKPGESQRLTPAARWVLITACCSGMLALAAQVLWSRMLIFSFEYLKNTTYAFSAMLTVFLFGLAAGSALIGPVVDSQPYPMRLYGMLLALIGISVTLSTRLAITGVESMQWTDPYNMETGQLDWVLAVTNIMLQTLGVMGIPTLLMGMSFPVAARLVAGVGHVGRDVGLLYSVNTLGAIIGSLMAGFVIVPLFGLTWGVFIIGLIYLGLGLATILRDRAELAHAGLMGALGLVVIAFVGMSLPGISRQGLQPLGSVLDQQVFYEEGPLATVAVVEKNSGERTIFVDGVGVAGTDDILQTDQKSLAHVPMMLLPNATSALTVGFGSGGASYSLLLHDRLERVDCVEICKTVLKAAPHLERANHHFFGEDQLPLDFAEQDDRYRIILDDARAWLRYTEDRYDFIATDCTDLRYKSNANLYDEEYFRACRQALTDDGIVVVWMPLAGLSLDVFKVALRTFHRVFPEMGIFFMSNEPTHYILLIGWQNDPHLDYRLFEQTLREPDVRADLAELLLDDPVKLLSCFITGGEVMDTFLGEGAINTENNPIIEFESPKYGFYDQPLIDNLDALMAHRVSPRRFIPAGTLPGDVEERLRRYEQALPSVLAGHAAYRSLEQLGVFRSIEQAVTHYLRAYELAPEDLSLRRLLRFPELTNRLRREPDNVIIHLMLTRAYMLQSERPKLEMAADTVRRAIELMRLESRDDPEYAELLATARGWERQILETLRPSGASGASGAPGAASPGP